VNPDVSASHVEASANELHVGDCGFQKCAMACLPRSITRSLAATMAPLLCIIERAPPVPQPAISSSESPCNSLIFSNGIYAHPNFRPKRRIEQRHPKRGPTTIQARQLARRIVFHDAARRTSRSAATRWVLERLR
jgi:hypothetical protein